MNQKHTVCHLCGGHGRPTTLPVPAHGEILVFRCKRCATQWACNLRDCGLCRRLEDRFGVTAAVPGYVPPQPLQIAEYLTPEQKMLAAMNTYDRIVLSAGRLAVRDADGDDPLAVALGMEGAPTMVTIFNALKGRRRAGSKTCSSLLLAVGEAIQAFDQRGINDVGAAFGR